MSSPFRHFRKHSKAFMAVAAVLCMFIFVIGSSFTGGGSGGDGNAANATVATWSGGSIDQSQLNALVTQRLITNDFLMRVFMQGGGKSEYDLPRDIPIGGLLLNEQQRANIEQVVVLTDVQAELAKRAGITVSDDLISDYISKMGLGNLNSEQIEQILASVGNGNPRTSEGIVMGTMRRMLAAYFYSYMYEDPAQVVLPHERWHDWKRVNERISIQAAVLPVDKFLPEVPEPNEEQLQALFDEFKDADPGRRVTIGGRTIASPDPGFAIPHRVRLQYVKGSVTTLAEKLMDKVSETDIAYYYEQHKDTDFLKMDVPASPTAPAEGATESSEPAEPAAETPATSETPSEPAAPSEEPAAPAAETPATEAPAAEAPATEAAPAETAPAAEGEKSSSDARPASPFRLVSFQEEAPAATEEAAAKTETPAAAETPAETAEATPPAAATEAEAAPATSTPAATAGADQYEPLENVRDEIRRELAREMAANELSRIMSESMAQLQTEFNTFGIALIEATEAGKKAPKPPAKLADLQWLADKHGLVYEKTSLLTSAELFDTQVGKAVGDPAQPKVVAQAAFTTLKPFEPFLATELEGDAFIVMKTEDVPRRIPEFKEVRDQVVAAWKQREAAKLAEKKAQELAAEIQKSNTPFDQFFFADRGYEVVKETALFSWLNFPAGQADFRTPPSFGDVPELKGVGPAFMEAAFGLKDNEAVGLLNYDQSAAYVIRLVRKQWSDDDLKRLFLEESEGWPGMYGMRGQRISRFSEALQQDMLVERADLKFDDKWVEERQKRQQQ
jgi:hypothetical protein